MGCCKIHPSSPPIFLSRKPKLGVVTVAAFSSSSSSNSQNQQRQPIPTRLQPTDVYSVEFKTLEACKLGISRYPNFEYDARGGWGAGTAKRNTKTDSNDAVSVCFDLETLYIPPLTSTTTRFLRLPLPPFLRINIVPQLFQGSICQESGKV